MCDTPVLHTHTLQGCPQLPYACLGPCRPREMIQAQPHVNINKQHLSHPFSSLCTGNTLQNQQRLH